MKVDKFVSQYHGCSPAKCIAHTQAGSMLPGIKGQTRDRIISEKACGLGCAVTYLLKVSRRAEFHAFRDQGRLAVLE